MNNTDNLEMARRELLDGKTEKLNELNVSVTMNKIEDHPKFGKQCIIILKNVDDVNHKQRR